MTVVVENVKGQAAKLASLADKINTEHKACEEATGTALAHALEAGRLLEEVKEALPHTAWGPWVKEHFAGSDRTERDYRRVWRNREQLPKQQSGSIAATLSLRQALKAPGRAQAATTSAVGAGGPGGLTTRSAGPKGARG